MIPFV